MLTAYVLVTSLLDQQLYLTAGFVHRTGWKVVNTPSTMIYCNLTDSTSFDMNEEKVNTRSSLMKKVYTEEIDRLIGQQTDRADYLSF